MAEKILYYLGAGASAKALPVAKVSHIKNDTNATSVPKTLTFELLNFDANDAVSTLQSHDLVSKIYKVAEDFKELGTKAARFGDVDTYARYLNIINPGGSEIKNLKKAISQYFSIKQIQGKAIDPRYLPWLVSLMEKKQFPDDVKVVSWNYDFQVQIAASYIGPLEEVRHEGSGFSHSPSFLTYFPNLDPTFNDFGFLSLIHLNGIAGFAEMPFPKTGSIFQSSYRQNKQSFYEFIIDNDIATKLHFAWDNSGYHFRLMEHVKKMISGTTIIVVIGYSFPFFNREVDKEIFNTLKHSGYLKKIYYQDPFLNGQQLKAQFELPKDFDVVHITNANNFYIPFEY